MGLLDSLETSRKLARQAISELFLDTSLDDDDFRRISSNLGSLQLPTSELDSIYFDEVAPVLFRNLQSSVGVWEGFDADWLDTEIQKSKKNQRMTAGIPILARFRRYWATRSTIADWEKVRAMLRQSQGRE